MNQKSPKSCKDSHKMDYVETASSMVAAVAGPREWNDTRERWLDRAARRLNFTYARTRALFYKRARVISAPEWDRLKEIHLTLIKNAEERRERLNAIAIGLAEYRPSEGSASPVPSGDGKGARGTGGAGSGGGCI